MKAATFFWYCILLAQLRGHRILAQHDCHSTIQVTANITTSNSSCTIDELSSVLERCTSNAVLVQLESGIHYLSNTLKFSSGENKTEFRGENYLNPSTIQCHRGAGILFSKNQSTVMISNIIFKNCSSGTPTTAILLRDISVCSLENVTISDAKGIGYYAQRCKTQRIKNCNFIGNSLEVKTSKSSVTISNTFFQKSNNTNGALVIEIHHRCTVTITNCSFTSNRGKIAGHLQIIDKSQQGTQVIITNCTFSNAEGPRFHYGVKICDTNVSIRNSAFQNNKNGLIIIHADYIFIENCSAHDNYGIALTIHKHYSTEIQIQNSTFQNNSKGGLNINISPPQSHQQKVHIFNCSFRNNGINFSKYGALRVERETSAEGNTELIIEKSDFVANTADSAALIVINTKNVTLKNLTFKNNFCTGIDIIASIVKIKSRLDIVNSLGYYGGAIGIESEVPFLLNETHNPQLILEANSEVHLINNTALFGGGIFIDRACPVENCFVTFEKNSSLHFLGNVAQRGGDAIYGDCLSNCIISSGTRANITDETNIFWDFVKSENHQSQSTFAEYPNKVVFCQERNVTNYVNTLEYTSNETKSIYKGQVFNVSLMATGNSHQPSALDINHTLSNTNLTITGENATNSSKNCDHYRYSIVGEEPENRTVDVEFSLDSRQRHYNKLSSAFLSIEIKPCPPALRDTNGKCECIDTLQNYSIVCNSSAYEFEVPTFTWIGIVPEQAVAMHPNCILCRKESEKTKFRNITLESDRLCIDNRIGVLCGSCPQNYSLQLGGYECGQCSGSEYRGILTILLFGVVGIILVALLFVLNLTVSTGKMNGFIFYCNIVYFNANKLALHTTQTNAFLKHTLHTLHFLWIFLAWMNLDFGIVTCFFDGYNTYISAWMQFLFPLYIWLIVLLIILASRYSRIISRLTTTNTVPVLATLLLLSYAKLLATCINAVSLTNLHILDNDTKYKVWELDGNIPYLHGQHIPLFVMSLLTLIIYIVPFTLLLLLGPALLAKSDHKFLSWLNRLKPFLDAFYGPYTSRYRYWPGILLLTRIGVFVSISVYSLDDAYYQLVVSAISATILFTVWIALGKDLNIYTNRYLNYFELFFHVNLALFSILLTYLWSTDDKVQLLTAVMVGSAFISFCGIIVYLTGKVIVTHNKQKIKKMIKLLQPTARKITTGQNAPGGNDTASNITHTHSNLEMKECISVFSELREPLLNDQ